jgi:hypothetical protein
LTFVLQEEEAKYAGMFGNKYNCYAVLLYTQYLLSFLIKSLLHFSLFEFPRKPTQNAFNDFSVISSYEIFECLYLRSTRLLGVGNHFNQHTAILSGPESSTLVSDFDMILSQFHPILEVTTYFPEIT